MESNPQQQIMDFKQTFGPEHGKRVLVFLKTVCFGDMERGPFGNTDRETNFNCGMNYVYRIIQMNIDAKVETKTADCITEPKPEQEK